MTDSDDIDVLAAEFVLGTLDPAERIAVAARRQREPGLEQSIQAWEARLGPLHELVAPEPPPPGLKEKVLARIGTPSRDGSAYRTPASGTPATVIDLQRRVNRWRVTALGASAIAASLAGLMVYRDATRAAQPASYVAVLQKDAASPAFLMTVDVAARTFTVTPVAAQRQPGKSYELWLVNDKLGAPKSLGLVGDTGFSAGVQLASYGQSDIREATYAVSLEPAGGSPTGAPTGPVLYAGKLVQARP